MFGLGVLKHHPAPPSQWQALNWGSCQSASDTQDWGLCKSNVEKKNNASGPFRLRPEEIYGHREKEMARNYVFLHVL